MYNSSSFPKDEEWFLDEATHLAWQRFCTIIASFLLLIGFGGLLWSFRSLNHPYPGAIWMVQSDPQTRKPVSFDFLPETTFLLRKDIGDIVRGNYVIAVNGIPVSEKPPDFRKSIPGSQVQLTFRKADGTLETHRLPLVRYTLEHWFYTHGALFLTGLSNLLAGWLLIKRAEDMPSFLMALILFATSLGGIHRGWMGMIDHLTPWHVVVSYGISFWLLGWFYFTLPPLFLHFATLYPASLGSPQLARRIRYWGYGIGFLLWLISLGDRLFYIVSSSFEVRLAAGRIAFMISLTIVFLLISTSVLLVITRVWRYRHRLQSDDVMMGMTFVGGGILILGGGVLLFWFDTPLWILSGFFYPLSILYPFLVFYAIRNVLLVRRLETQLEQIKAMERELQEVKRFRERSLRDIANLLHDNVLADLKGAQFVLTALLSDTPEENGFVWEKMRLVENSLSATVTRLRNIVEGVRPVHFSSEGLRVPLQRLFEAFRALHGNRMQLSLYVDPRFDALPPDIQERVYAIVRLALSNALEHSQGTRFEAKLQVEEEGDTWHLFVSLQDNGRGFDVEKGLAEAKMRGHLGLVNIQSYAAQIGATCQILSQVGKGTWILLNARVRASAADEEDV